MVLEGLQKRISDFLGLGDKHHQLPKDSVLRRYNNVLYSKSENSTTRPDLLSIPSIEPVIYRALSHAGGRISNIQKAFDVYVSLNLDPDMMQLRENLKQGLIQLNPSFIWKKGDIDEIFRIADTTQANKLHFAEFYAISACMSVFKLHFGNAPYVTKEQATIALANAGIEISKDQLDHMFQNAHDDNLAAIGDPAHLTFSSFLQVYLTSPRSEIELFLHSWYKSGRSNFLQHRQHFEVSAWHDFVAGTAAGIALTLVGHPFDTIRTRLQTNGQFKGAIDCIMQTIRKEGPLAVYKGMSGPMLAIPFINAIVFACYGQAREVLSKFNGNNNELSLTQIGIAGAYAGIVNCLVATPIELVRIRLQTQYSNHSAAFKGPIDCITHIQRANGVKGLFRGMAATVYREIPGYSGQFVAYESLKRAFMKHGKREEFELTAVELLSAGGLAGMAGWICSYPCDYIKAQIMAEPWNKKSKYKKHPIFLDGGFIDAFQKTVKSKGYGELWKGFGVCMIRAWPANAVGFLAYENVLTLIRKQTLTRLEKTL